METKNLLNKKITQWLLLVAMLVGCSANAWADAIPSGTTIFLDFTNCDFTTNGYSSGVYVSVVGSGNAGKVADKGNTSGAGSYIPKDDNTWYTASKVGTSKIYKFTTTQEIGSNGFSVWSKNASSYNNCWEMNVRLCITDYNGANCYQFESGCTNHGDRKTNCYSGSWKKYVTGTIYYDNTNTKFSTCYNYIGRGNYTKCYTMERVSGTQYLWKKTYDFVDFTMWYVSSEKWWEEDNSDVYYYGGHTTKTVTMKYESPWTDGEVYKASSTLDYITDYGKNIQGYKWDSPAHSTVNNYTVTISNGTGGTTTVKDYDNATVSTGASKIYLTVLKITVTPNSGYNIKKVTVGGTDYTSSAESGEFTYTVKAATTISVTYEKACTPPTIDSTTPGSRCGTGTVTIGATASAGTVKWYDANTGGNLLYTGSPYQPSVESTTDYYAEADDNGCISTSRTSVTATVNSIPTITANDNSRCGAGDITLTATPSSEASVDWYDSSTGDNKVAENTTSLTVQGVTVGSPVTRYAEAVKNGCKSSSRAQAVATAKLIPAVSNIALTGSGECGTGDVTFTATATENSTITWYDGGSSKGTDNPITISIAGGSSKTLTAKATLDGCEESTGMSEEGSRKVAPVISASTTNTTAYEVITLESTSGSVQWSKDAADKKAYFVKDHKAVDDNTVEAVSVNFKAPAKVGAYTVTAKGGNDCTSNVSITIGTAQEECGN